MTVTIFGTAYECTRAVKGRDFVRLYQGDTIILTCLEVSDFSNYVLTSGEWSDPDPDLDVVADSAVLSNGSITITSDKIIGTGTLLKFKAPCDCTAVTKGLVIDGKTYSVVDALGEVITGASGTWASGSQVSVLIDKENLRAFVQNGAKASGILGVENSTLVQFVGNIFKTLGGKNLNVVRMETGSYVGTGTSGSSSAANSLTFEFVPKALIVCSNRSNSSMNTMVWLGQPGGKGGLLFTLDGTTLSWYSDSTSSSAQVQMNTSGEEYYYMALG